MPGNRRYSMSLRDEQTDQTRRRILTAAGRLFTERGYLGTTLTGIAEAAGVSVQTIYNLVGGKSVLLKAVWDVTLAGDDEPVPMSQRPVAIAVMEATDAHAALDRYAAMAREINERILPLVTVLLAQATTGDAELREFAETIQREHTAGTQRMAGHIAERFGLRPGLDAAAATDVIWALTGPELTNRLINGRGWSWDRYQAWLAVTLADMLLDPDSDAAGEQP